MSKGRGYQDDDDSDDDLFLRQCTQQSRKQGKHCANMSNCRYDIVRFSLKFLSFRECDKTDHCQLIWTDNPPTYETLARLTKQQCLSRFPSMNELSRKGIFFHHINRMRLTFPNEFRFVPRTWVLPQDSAEIQEEFGLAQPNEKPRTYIVKPSSGSQGHGIYLIQSLQEIRPAQGQVVVQRYVDKPFLIDGLKFDFRIYVLISSVSRPNSPENVNRSPIRIWLGREGLARFCTKPYVNVTKDNLGEAFMHLTNYAINKHSTNFVSNTDVHEDSKGSKRSLSSVTRLLRSKGYQVDRMWEEIVAVISKTMLAIAPSLLSGYALHAPQPAFSASSPDQFDPTLHSHCFHIIGFDIMLDHRLRPWIVEINHSPSFVADSPLDQKIKFQVICGAVRLMMKLNGMPLRMDQPKEGEESESVGSLEESPEDFYRLIYPASAPSPSPTPDDPESDLISTSLINQMNIFNACVLHEAFYKGCSVRGMNGLKIISDTGFYATKRFRNHFREYARRSAIIESLAAPHTSQPSYTSRVSSFRPKPTTSLAQRQVQSTGMGCSKFCQFGRNAGLADGRSITQADLDLLYREVTRHSWSSTQLSGTTPRQKGPAQSRSSSRTPGSSGGYGSVSSGGGGGSGGGLGMMGFGEFCTAVLILATRHYPDMSYYDAMLRIVGRMENIFVTQTKLPQLPPTLQTLTPSYQPPKPKQPTKVVPH
ncbi:putative tubulin-tyrosine ligase family protein [Blattamonas nauphoetae]|uniref:Tubulin-tyrosine ligase family protein n=1 Tax=Blattamonas nauphoetae TaxID=2049346 RepID=A0ABQ9Y9Q6_9EUKA|nr:putative tubulin-tyrosine ligase family protein [Blattamonas nauphoetae]